MKKKVLLVEDEALLGELLSRTITGAGFKVVLITDGSKAIPAMVDEKPDIVLLDIILPNKNGYEILEEVVKDKELKQIPVIVISNSGQPVEISRILKLGVKDYIVKAQINPDDVVVKVREQLEKNNPNTDEQNTLKGKKILWAEDDELLGSILEKKFKTQESDLIHVKNGEGVLTYLKDNTADIVILDILLPGQDGLSVLKEIKSKDKTKDIPVVLLSNLNDPDHLAKSQEYGASKFLIKASLTLDEIIHNIAQILSA
jgi:DNA-binding response OmpR family regulator